MTHRALFPLILLASLPAAALPPAPAITVGLAAPAAAANPASLPPPGTATPPGAPAMPGAADALAPASEPVEVKPDCEGLQQQALAQADRGYQAVSRKLWNDALGLLRGAGQAYGEIVQHCPAQKDDALLRGQRVGEAIQQAEAAFNHQTRCQPRLDGALEIDIRVSAARREKRDARDMETLYAESEAAWRAAQDNCQSPHREKAERNLAATLRMRQENVEQLSSGPACDTAWKNANSIGELARDAWKAKRWDEAALLYNKTQFAWERVQENCAGSRQQGAAKKIEQAQLDAHNAEFCGPQWDEASDLAQQMRSGAASASVGEREVLSFRAEVAWRSAATQCRGTPQTLARNNADAILRERGTALPANAQQTYGRPLAAPAPTPATAVAVAASTSATAGTPAVAAPPAPTVTTAVGAPQVEQAALQTAPPAVAKPATEVPPPAVKTAPPAAPLNKAADSNGNGALPATAPAAAPTPAKVAPPAEDVELVADGTTYRGRFELDPNSGLPTGSGTVEWTNGDRYVGRIVAGLRQGKGRFDWRGGQWYDGDWRDNLASGRGVLFFANGNRYEGEVRNGQPHGRGNLVFPGGDRYSGDFADGLFHGQGSYVWKSGSRYDGQWALGRKAGQGRLTQSDGSGWEGEYKDDYETDHGQPFKAGTAAGKLAAGQAAR